MQCIFGKKVYTNFRIGKFLKKLASEGRIILTFDLDFGEIIALSEGILVSVILFRLRNTRTPHVMNVLNMY
ncbi:hypothetical protein KSMBR1_2343 [Candidatus Kuenenia stuttgartiensis]|uniref:DUF5615 domain-containing protein n=1 Tax=Kuenenia stuttgartiensis TaxID=174633 RepID=A0A2C9CGV3_KUEST|nr:hypothetical protein KSMBR1_2343 [Candidatus Kuenenia stuttgartiensis]